MNNKEQKALCDDLEEELDEKLEELRRTTYLELFEYEKDLKNFIKTLLQKQRAEIIKELRDECVGEERQLDELSGYPDNCIVGMNIKRRELIEIFNNKLK